MPIKINTPISSKPFIRVDSNGYVQSEKRVIQLGRILRPMNGTDKYTFSPGYCSIEGEELVELGQKLIQLNKERKKNRVV